jgi:alpha-L-fucosidase
MNDIVTPHAETEALMAPDFTWFNQARFGIFVHWGLYSVGQYEASWAFFNHGTPGQDPRDSIPYEQYMAQRHAFLARRYDPAAWCDLFKAAGARYTVLGTKHHDGVALWDSAEGLTTVRDCAVQRDLVTPFVAAARASGLHLGLYYSHIDWSHPDYASVRQPNGFTHIPPSSPSYRFAYPQGPDDPARWENFLRFHRLQLRELCERFSPELLWFDGHWERSSQQWRFAELRRQLLAWRPGVILNGRMGGYGDYDTPEQGIPTSPPRGVWELCLTMNRSWSMALDPSYKSTQELVRVLCECAGMGGNLLLNVSPLGDGTIFYEQARILREMGAWLAVNGQAIYGTTAGLPPTHFYGPSTVSADRKTLYLFVLDRPWNEVAVKGLRSQVKSITLLGQQGELPHRRSGGAEFANIPGVLWIQVPAAACHPLGTVVKIELHGPLDVLAGEGQVVTQN